MPGGYDNIYYNYILEHSYLWIKGIHNLFWSAPINYYDIHSVAQADSLIGIAPIYWIIRLLIKNPFSAFQILFVFLCILNYSTFYFLMKKLKLNRLPCAAGALIFAFSTLRFFNYDNFPCFSQFLSVIAIIFLLQVNTRNKNIINHFYFLLSSIFLILQFYTNFAIGFFTIFCALFSILFSLLPKNSRDIVIDFIRKFYKYILFYLFVTFIMLLPMAYHFSCLGYYNPLSNILSNLANYTIWIRSLSMIDNIINLHFDYVGLKANLSSVSLGLFTTVVSLYALYNTQKVKGVSLLTLLFIVLISSGYSAIYFWKIFYYFSFGIESLESVNSVSFIALFIISIGISLFFQNIKNKFILFSVLILVIFEQISYNNDFNSSLKNNFISKQDFIQSINKIKVEDKIINIKFNALNEKEFGKNDIKIKKLKAQKIADLTAMWVGLRENKPVLNNYMNKSKPQKSYTAKEIDLKVDYNQI